MKKFLVSSVILLMSITTAFSQSKVDYNEYEVLANSGNITVVAKEKDYRMIVGPIKKPTAVFILGHSKELVENKFERLLVTCGNDKYSKKNRDISFCGIPLHYSVIGNGNAEQYTFVGDLDNVKFLISKEDILTIKGQLAEYNK